MAPVCRAARLSLSACILFLLFLQWFVQCAESYFQYDRRALLELRTFAEIPAEFLNSGQHSPPPVLSEIPAFLLRDPGLSPWRKRRRRRGKRAGILVKLRQSVDYSIRTRSGSDHLLSDPWCSRGPAAGQLPARSVHGNTWSCLPVRRTSRPGGAVLHNLRPLARASPSTAVPVSDNIRMCLINARSVSNKTFILNDFFKDEELDFLFVTESWISDGPGLVFVVYPQAFASMPVAQLWAVLFFFMLLCLGLDSEFAMVEVMVTSLLDEFYHHLIKFFKRKEVFVLAVCGVALLLGIPCVMQVGIYIFQLMDHYTAIVSIMFLAFFEIIAICWSYGVKRLSNNLEEMTGRKPNIFFRLCWLIVDPVLITVILIFSIIQFKPARYENYVFPPWAQGVGWIIALASIIWIPLAAVHTLWVLPGSFTQKLKLSITPFTLDDKSQTLYYERRGTVGQPDEAAISPRMSLPEKPLETNF